MRPYRSGDGPLDGMIELLVANSQAPPKEVKGVSQGFLDGELASPLPSRAVGSIAPLLLELKKARSWNLFFFICEDTALRSYG